MSKQYVVSACLAGESCRYDGGCSPCPSVQALVRTGQALPVCPEVLGGLPTPRVPSEIRGGACRRPKTERRDPPVLTCGAEGSFAAGVGKRLHSGDPQGPLSFLWIGEIYDGSFTGTRVPAKAFSPVWHVRRDSKSGARRRSPKEDSPSCRKSTDGIKTKSTSTRGVAGCETVFSRGMHKKSLQRTAFVPQAGMEGNLCRKSLRAQIR